MGLNFGGDTWTRYVWEGFQWVGAQFRSAITSDALRNVATWLASRIKDLAEAVAKGLARLGGLIKWLGGALKNLWVDILRPGIGKLFEWIQRLSDLLRKWFGPIVKWIQRFRDEFLKIYNKYVKPILDIIDIARRVLRVAGSLGLDWAKDLERKLARLQEEISRPFMEVVAKLNQAIDWINRIITLDGLLQRFTLFRSLWVYRRDFVNFNINTGFRKATTEERSRVLTPQEPVRLDERLPAIVAAASGKDPATNARVRELVGEIVSAWR